MTAELLRRRLESWRFTMSDRDGLPLVDGHARAIQPVGRGLPRSMEMPARSTALMLARPLGRIGVVTLGDDSERYSCDVGREAEGMAWMDIWGQPQPMVDTVIDGIRIDLSHRPMVAFYQGETMVMYVFPQKEEQMPTTEKIAVFWGKDGRAYHARGFNEKADPQHFDLANKYPNALEGGSTALVVDALVVPLPEGQKSLEKPGVRTGVPFSKEPKAGCWGWAEIRKTEEAPDA